MLKRQFLKVISPYLAQPISFLRILATSTDYHIVIMCIFTYVCGYLHSFLLFCFISHNISWALPELKTRLVKMALLHQLLLKPFSLVTIAQS